MDDSGFRLERLETEEDVQQNLVLMRVVFGELAGVDKLVQKLIVHHPSMTLHDFLVIKHNEKIVASVALIPVRWSVGGVPMKVAELGMVATLPEYRRRGLIRQLVDEYHRQVRQQGYDFSVLEGIPYFYRQFGYEYALPLLEETRIGLELIPECSSGVKIRPFTVKDLPKAMRLLEYSQKKFYVHSLRGPQIWGIQHETAMASDPEPFEAYAVDDEEEMAAYFRIRENPDEKELMLTEVTEVDRLCSQAILGFMKERGRNHGLKTLAACVSYQEPLSQHLAAIGGTRRTPVYAWQVKIVDYLKIFCKLKPLFEKRLAHSMYRRLTETLNFNFREFTIRMAIESGRIIDVKRVEGGERSPIGLNPLAFVKLLLGDWHRDELERAYPDCRVDSTYRHLIDVMFPKKPSYIHSAY